MKIKYDSHMGDWCSKEVVGVWKCIQRGWGGFAQHVRYDIGDGMKVLFWHDVGCGECPLKLVYPALFNIACNKDALVKEYMERLNGYSFIGMSGLFGLCMIGNWRWYHTSLHCCIPKKSDLEVRIKFVGFRPKEILLK